MHVFCSKLKGGGVSQGTLYGATGNGTTVMNSLICNQPTCNSDICLRTSESQSKMAIGLKRSFAVESMQTLSHAGLQSVPPGSTVQQVTYSCFGLSLFCSLFVFSLLLAFLLLQITSIPCEILAPCLLQPNAASEALLSVDSWVQARGP